MAARWERSPINLKMFMSVGMPARVKLRGKTRTRAQLVSGQDESMD